MMEISQESKEFYKKLLVAVLLITVCVINYYWRVILKTEVIISHFFYFPAVLAAFWWRKKGLSVAIISVVYLETVHIITQHEETILYNIFRGGFILTVSYLVAVLSNELKKSRLSLKNEELRFRVLAEHLPQKVFVKDANSVYLFCNQNYADDLNIKTDAIEGKTDYDFFPPEISEKYRQDDKTVIKSGKTKDFDEKYIVKGEERWVHSVKTPYKSQEGVTIGVLGIFWDITGYKKIEMDLKNMVRDWDSIFDSISDFVFILDKYHTIEKANLSFASALNLTPAELIGKKCYEVLHKSNMPWQDCPFKRTRVDHLPHSVEIDDPKINMPLLVTSSPIFDEEHNLVGAVHIARDISKLKEEKLKNLELMRQIEFILGATKTGLDIIDSEFNLRFVDAQWAKIYGDYKGKKCYEYFLDSKYPCPDCKIPQVLKTKKAITSEHTLPKEGNRPIRVISFPYQDSNKDWLVAEVNIDISAKSQE